MVTPVPSQSPMAKSTAESTPVKSTPASAVKATTPPPPTQDDLDLNLDEFDVGGISKGGSVDLDLDSEEWK